MNNFAYCLLLPAALFVGQFAWGDETPVKKVVQPGQFGGDETFRIGMGQKSGSDGAQFGPTSPGTPDNGMYWNDVGDWQAFLLNQGMGFYLTGQTVTDPQTNITYPIYAGLDGSHPNDVFDQQTEDATKAWQTQYNITNKPTKPLTVSGVVDQDTYNAAVALDPVLKKTTPIPSPYLGKKVPTLPNLDDYFGERGKREHKGASDHDIYLELGHGPHGPDVAPCDLLRDHLSREQYWSDVSRWQDFLINCGGQNLGPNYPNNNFDAATVQATMKFQLSSFGGAPFSTADANGKVNQATLAKARKAISDCKLNSTSSGPDSSPPATPQPDAPKP